MNLWRRIFQTVRTGRATVPDGFYWIYWIHNGRWEPAEVFKGEVWVLGREYPYALSDVSAFERLPRPRALKRWKVLGRLW